MIIIYLFVIHALTCDFVYNVRKSFKLFEIKLLRFAAKAFSQFEFNAQSNYCLKKSLLIDVDLYAIH